MLQAPTLVGRGRVATLALVRAEERAPHGDDDALWELVKGRVLEGLEQELAEMRLELVVLVQKLEVMVQELEVLERATVALEQEDTEQVPVVDEPVQRHEDEAQAAKAPVQVLQRGNEVQGTTGREQVRPHGNALVAAPVELNRNVPVWLNAVQKDAKA